MFSLQAPITNEVASETVTVIASENYGPMTDSENVEKFVKDYFADIPNLSRIAFCESTYRHYDKYGHVLKGKVDSRDVGVMQINLYYHAETAEKLGLDLYDIDDNVAYARYLYERDSSKPWNASKHCWDKPSQIAQK